MNTTSNKAPARKRPAARRAPRAALRAARAERPPRRYEALSSADLVSRARAERTMAEGWRCGGLPTVKLVPPIEWDAYAADRGCARRLHAWEPLGPILRLFDDAHTAEVLDFATRLAIDWVRTHPGVEPESVAWHGTAVAARAYRLAFVVDMLARDGNSSDDEVGLLLDSLMLHADRLADERAFRVRTNQGFHQAAGQLAVAARFPELDGMPGARAQAIDRLRRLLAEQFSAEGVHREHSPAYQASVLAVLEPILAADFALDEDVAAMRESIEDALAWMIAPNGTLATIGDTEPRLRPPAPVGALASPHLRHVLSAGASGAAPSEAVRAFPSAGYVAFRRQAAAPADSSYLLQICGFHSRAHKHADDLSFVWHDRGEELTVDPGRYGYGDRTKPGSELYEQGFWYSDPKRIYVESTAAHNTVEVDARSHARKAVRPYGSALTRWGEAGQVLYSEARVRHRRSIVHSRVLMLLPGAWLIVLDALADTSGATHDYVQRFHFGPNLTARSIGSGLSLTAPGQDAPLYVLPLLAAQHLGPVRGQKEPLLGWISRREGSLEPVWTDAFGVQDASTHVFATLLAFGDSKPRVDPQSRSNTSGRRARLIWFADGGRHQVDLNREPAELALNYKTKRGA